MEKKCYRMGIFQFLAANQPTIGLFVLFVGFVFPLNGAPMPEVDPNKIPDRYIKKSVKKISSLGIVIWDAKEALAALDKGESVLWVDTRPQFLYDRGTVRDAVLFVYHKYNDLIFPSQRPFLLTRAKIYAAMRGKKRIAYFCQGTRCHRSYNAALRSVQQWGIPASRIIWFREGYPGLLKIIKKNPALKRRMEIYFQGDIVK